MRTSTIARLVTVLLIIFATITLMGAKKTKNVGIVNMLVGSATRYPNGSTEAKILDIGSKIYILDRIVTNADTKLQVVFRDDSVITLSPNSELVVDKDSYNFLLRKRTTQLSLLRGKIRSVVGKRYSRGKSKFEVHTRTAIAGVRGTENIVVDIPEPPSTDVFALYHTTYVRNSQDKKNMSELPIKPKQGAHVRQGEAPKLFDFDFNDPSFRKLLDDTTAPGGDDVENDIGMNSFGGPQPDGANGRNGDSFQSDESGTEDTPPYNEEVNPRPEPTGSESHDNYYINHQ